MKKLAFQERERHVLRRPPLRAGGHAGTAPSTRSSSCHCQLATGRAR
jgi:hypothetical protein